MILNYFDPQLRHSIERLLLPDIQRPGQYIGGELGQIHKQPDSVRGRLCMAFPETYPIGMSNYGLSLLYHIMNKRADWSCERAFTPFPDMEALLRNSNLPLYSLETFTPLFCFDLVGFSLQYELMNTNVLTMLELGRIPLHREERVDEDPLIIAGGPAVCNPEPMSDFIDLYVLGDGEEALVELADFWLRRKLESAIQFRSKTENGRLVSEVNSEVNIGPSRVKRRQILLEIARKFPWAYVPEFYDTVQQPNGRLGRPRPTEEGVPEYIKPAIVKNLDDYPPSELPIIPLIESVQDRISVEIMRGCPQHCRFCQSSPLKRPLRLRSIDQIVHLVKESTERTGTGSVTLLSLSSSEYPQFDKLVNKLKSLVGPCGVSLSVPSLRVNHQLSDLVQALSPESQSSITIAPEAALDTMRLRIAKNVTNEDLMTGCRTAFENGFQRIKLYFMCGFPGETEEDLVGIIHLCDEIVKLGKSTMGRYPAIIANVSNFVPKPHTPLQWYGMASGDYFHEAHRILRTTRRFRCVDLKYHSLRTSLLEGLLARGDRRLGAVIEAAWRKGARLDAWTDYFHHEYWDEAIAESGIDVQLMEHTSYSLEEELPWDVMTTFSGKDFLMREYHLFEGR